MSEPSLFPDITTRSERREIKRNPEPEFIYQAMGAGVQSTTIALLAANGEIPKPDFAVFSDTSWEPPYVYKHLDLLDTQVLQPAGITLVRVVNGDLRHDTISPHHMRRIPVYTIDKSTGRRGFTIRGCTGDYKIGAMFRWLREQLGGAVVESTCPKCTGYGERDAPWLVKAGYCDSWGECSVCRGTGRIRRVGKPPSGKWALTYVGFSVDEMERASDSGVAYQRTNYPLLDLRMTRDDCETYLHQHGWTNVQKSACVGCPFHSNAEWRRIKADPELWANALEVDRAIRHPIGLDSVQAFLHRDRKPLELVDISTGDNTELGSCSPFGCRSGDPIKQPDLNAEWMLF